MKREEKKFNTIFQSLLNIIINSAGKNYITSNLILILILTYTLIIHE